MRMLTSTQSFNLFIEKSFKNDWEGDNEIKMFIKTLQLLEQGKVTGISKIEKAFANPIKFDYDHWLCEYAKRLSDKIKSEHNPFIPTRAFDYNNLDNKSGCLFFYQDKIIQMPGINYDKIKIYRMYKKWNSKSPTNRLLNNESKVQNQNSQKEEYKKQKQRYKSIWNLKNLHSTHNFSDFMSPSNDYLKRSGNKQINYGSRNNSPGEVLGTKMSVNSSYGVFKFNISMEEDKLKSIMNNAKSKGFIKFDPSISIRISKNSSKSKLKPFEKNSSIKRDSKPKSPNVSHQEIDENASNMSKPKRFNPKAKSFLSCCPSKSAKFNSSSPQNRDLNSNMLKMNDLTLNDTSKFHQSTEAMMLSLNKQIKTTTNSPMGNNKVDSEWNESVKCLPRKLSSAQSYRYLYERWKQKSYHKSSIFLNSNWGSRKYDFSLILIEHLNIR